MCIVAVRRTADGNEAGRLAILANRPVLAEQARLKKLQAFVVLSSLVVFPTDN